MWNPIANRRKIHRSRGSIILLYHRVTCLQRDPWSLAVTPAQFESQLSVLRHIGHPIHLGEITISEGTANKPAIAITFDDGYEDNLLQAEPLLRRFEIPASVFIVSGAMDSKREFWWDELEHILLGPAPKPPVLELEIRDRLHRWAISDWHCTVQDADWQPWGHSHPSQAHRTYRDIYDLLFPLGVRDRIQAMDELRRWAGLEQESRPSHRPLSRQQLWTLAQSPVIDVGVHTVNHPCLSLLTAAEQREEILGAKTQIEEFTGREPRLFSYPYGKHEHFSEETVRIVEELGFSHACANVAGLVRPGADRLQLPRVLAPPIQGEAFSQWLTHCYQNLE